VLFCGFNAQDWAKNTLAGKLSKSDKLGMTDHSKVDYPPFRRSFYTETGALAKMTEEEVAAYRKELDDIKVVSLSSSNLVICIIMSKSVWICSLSCIRCLCHIAFIDWMAPAQLCRA